MIDSTVAFVCVFQFIDLCRTVTDNDTVVLKLLQQKYNHANRHFIWSDEFCQLIQTYSGRICADPGNKYVHIRDIVSELRRYKAKPMKNIKPLTHTVGVDSDQSTESDGGPPAAKHRKTEAVSVKEESGGTTQEHSSTNDVASLPSLLRLSSSTCKFVPLSAMSNGMTSTGVDLAGCKLQVLGDDADSCSSFDDANSARLAESQIAIQEVGTELSTGPVDDSQELLDLADVRKTSEKQLVEHPASVSAEQLCTSSEVEGQGVSPVSDDVEPTAHCSKDDQPAPESDGGGKVKAKLASARQIRYLESLLSVCNCSLFLLA